MSRVGRELRRTERVRIVAFVGIFIPFVDALPASTRRRVGFYSKIARILLPGNSVTLAPLRGLLFISRHFSIVGISFFLIEMLFCDLFRHCFSHRYVARWPLPPERWPAS